MLRGSRPKSLAPWYQRVPPVQALAVLVSLLMTVVAVAQDPMLNSDGVLYLLAAESFAAGDLNLTLSLHKLPLYPVLIASMQSLTGAQFETSAYLVNGLLQALLVFAFIGAVAEVEGTQRNAWLAAVVILSFTGFNDYRSEIIRGFGYWALAMPGFWLFVRYMRTGRVGVLAGALLLFAVTPLFRAEGLVLVLLMPFAILLRPDCPLAIRVRHLITVGAIYLVLLGLLVAAMLVAGNTPPATMLDFPLAHVSNVVSALTEHMQAREAAVAQHLLGRFSYEYAGAVVWATILIILAGELLSSLGWVHGLAVFLALRAGMSQLTSYGRPALLAMMLINLLLLGAFVIASGFLTGRYTLAFALFALLLAPTGVRVAYRAAKTRYPAGRQVPVLVSVLGLAAFYMLVDGVVSLSPGKVHAQSAAVWLRDNTDASASVLSFDPTISYRAGRLTAAAYAERLKRPRKVTQAGQTTMKSWQLALEENRWQRHDYVVASIGRKRLHEQAEIERVIGRPPLKVFENSRKDRVVVFDVRALPVAVD